MAGLINTLHLIAVSPMLLFTTIARIFELVWLTMLVRSGRLAKHILDLTGGHRQRLGQSEARSLSHWIR